MEPDMNPVIPEPASSGFPLSGQNLFYTRKRELIFCLMVFVFAVFAANSVIEGGFRLGFVLGMAGSLVSVLVYLGRSLRWNGYRACLVAGAFGLLALYAYSDDIRLLVLAIPLAFYLVWNLALGDLTGANRRKPGGIGCVSDAINTMFHLSFRDMGGNLRALGYEKKGDGLAKRKIGGVLLGLVISIPLLAVILPLLMASDAAFEGLMDRTIFSDMGTLFGTVLGAVLICLPSYSQSVTLARIRRQEPEERPYKGLMSSMTLNTILFMVGFFYILYLFSQLAYFFNAFSGILPKGFTTAQYARRGFFEMCGICALNLAMISLVAGLVNRKDGEIPRLTKALCIFVCLFCLVLVAASASKMALYVSSFGLTRKRIMTFVCMLVLAVAIVSVGIWLLKPRFPYMKVIVLTSLAAVLLVGWVDVDTQVARYNVSAYQSGALEEIDMTTLSGLSAGATPYVAQLLEDENPEVAETAKNILRKHLKYYDLNEDNTAMLPMEFQQWYWKGAREVQILDSLLPVLTAKD